MSKRKGRDHVAATPVRTEPEPTYDAMHNKALLWDVTITPEQVTLARRAIDRLTGGDPDLLDALGLT